MSQTPTIFRERLITRKQSIKSAASIYLVTLHLPDQNPLSYRQIQYAYNKALKLIGLFPRFSSTHIMRHSMANLVRSISDLDTAQAVGGWKSRDIVESVYTDTPVHVADKARKDIENLLFSDEESDDFDPEPIVNDSFGALKLLKS
jgi:integrase